MRILLSTILFAMLAACGGAKKAPAAPGSAAQPAESESEKKSDDADSLNDDEAEPDKAKADPCEGGE